MRVVIQTSANVLRARILSIHFELYNYNLNLFQIYLKKLQAISNPITSRFKDRFW